jgi:lycopene beta-cyclase
MVGGRQIQGSLVLDATGHRRQLVKFDQDFDPGYQGAYGIIAGGAWGSGRRRSL